MKKWKRRIVLALTTVIGIVVILSMVGLLLFRGEPNWYQPYAMDDQERSVATRQVMDKLSLAQNVANYNLATSASHVKSESVSLSLSQDELTVLLETWITPSQDRSVQDFIRPQVVLKDGKIIVAAKSQQMGTVISLELAPKLDQNGRLELNLVNAYAGRLPVPVKVMQGFRSFIGVALPDVQKKAGLGREGSINRDAARAMGIRMVLETLDHQSSEPILPIPILGGGNVPMKVTELKVEDGDLVVKADPISSDDSIALVDRIREPYHAPVK